MSEHERKSKSKSRRKEVDRVTSGLRDVEVNDDSEDEGVGSNSDAMEDVVSPVERLYSGHSTQVFWGPRSPKREGPNLCLEMLDPTVRFKGSKIDLNRQKNLPARDVQQSLVITSEFTCFSLRGKHYPASVSRGAIGIPTGTHSPCLLTDGLIDALAPQWS
ncbi:hypothetical protein L218DRAFT_947170 [Marasmius fiardii PR-910]|nr:hypothetical protein L218DRAFT_947170 [Marasmius fiardii PR-910]